MIRINFVLAPILLAITLLASPCVAHCQTSTGVTQTDPDVVDLLGGDLITLHPDGKSFAFVNNQRMITTHLLSGKQPAHEVGRNPFHPRCLSYSADASQIYCGGYNGTFSSWDIATGTRLMQSQIDPKEPIVSTSAYPELSLIFLLTRRGDVYWIDQKTFSARGHFESGFKDCSQLVVNPATSTLGIAGNHGFRLLSFHEGKLIHAPHIYDKVGYAAVLSPKMDMVVFETGVFGTDSSLAHLDYPHQPVYIRGRLKWFSADEEIIVVGGTADVHKKISPKFPDSFAGEDLQAFSTNGKQLHAFAPDPGHDVAVTPDRKYIITWGTTGLIRVRKCSGF
ncbi:MAG: WD40 repeat domain-containing protein [Chthonomonadales bacterium]